MCGQGTCRVHPGEARLGGPRGIRAIQRLTPNVPGMLGLHLNPEPWPFTTVCLPSPLPIVQIFLDKPAPLEVHRPQDMSPGSQNPRVTGGAPPRGPQDNPFLPRATLLSLFGHQLKVPEQVLFEGTVVAAQWGLRDAPRIAFPGVAMTMTTVGPENNRNAFSHRSGGQKSEAKALQSWLLQEVLGGVH